MINYRLNQIVEQQRKLESQIQELQTNRRKSQAIERQSKINSLQLYYEDTKKVFEIVQQNIKIDEKLWKDYIELLSCLYQNLENPLYESDLKKYTQQILDLNIFKPLEPIEQNQWNSLSKQAQLIDQSNVQYKLKCMELSYKDRPQSNDFYPPPQFKEKTNIKSIFPKYKMIPPETFNKFSLEVLFYIFYNHKEPSEYIMAGQALNSQGWIFNTKHGIWLKKDQKQEQFNETDEYIQGQFLYFEYESKWSQKRKQDYKVKKKYLLEFNK